MTSKLHLFLRFLSDHLLTLLSFSCMNSSLFSPPPPGKAKWWIQTAWHSLTPSPSKNSGMLSGAWVFSIHFVAENSGGSVTPWKRYLPQSYGHVLIQVLPSGTGRFSARKNKMLLGGGQPWSQAWEGWGEAMVEDISQPVFYLAHLTFFYTLYLLLLSKKEILSIYYIPATPVQFSSSVVSNSLWPHELQLTRPPCPSPTPGVHSNSCPSSQ